MNDIDLKRELCSISLKLAYDEYMGLSRNPTLIQRCDFLFRQLEMRYNQPKITLTPAQLTQLRILFDTAKNYKMSQKVFANILHDIVGDELFIKCLNHVQNKQLKR